LLCTGQPWFAAQGGKVENERMEKGHLAAADLRLECYGRGCA